MSAGPDAKVLPSPSPNLGEQRLLGNIERLTKQKIAIGKVPSVADLRARQIEITITTLKEALASDDLENYARVLDVLGEEFDPRLIALAAVKLTHAATGATVDEKEIPDAADRLDRVRPAKPAPFGRSAPDRERGRASELRSG